MTTTFNREVRPVNIIVLKNLLNNSPNITSTVLSIELDSSSTAGNNIVIYWNQDLIAVEITNMDSVISSYVFIPEVLDISQLPLSDLGDMLAVHSSTKPKVTGKEFYLVWTGAGDDVINGIIGEGDLLTFSLTPALASVSKEIRFDSQFGDVYIHEGYAKWNNGSVGDYMTAAIVSDPTILQQVANLDLVVDSLNWVKYAPGGAGTGTDGFSANPVLVPRTFTKDGDWDYDGINLIPNINGTGVYKISTVERIVHKYINKIPLCNSSAGYDRLTSDETAFLPSGYFIRVTIYNTSATTWNCAFMFEVYRERTAVP